ncbi:MAG: hypothetical protein ISS55_01155 [Dehalococcoidales bacterium]|nr:hypothetical protein [Dehalococcoidales bacterium]
MGIAGVHAEDGIECLRENPADRTTTVMLCERKPVTIWEIAARLGDNRTERTSAVLERLTADGTLVRFRVGLSDYYATPKEALTGDGPGSGTVITDSLKNLLLGYRYRRVRHQRQNPGVTAL